MGKENCEYCGDVKKDFGCNLLAELDMKLKPNWMKREYALAQEIGHYKEFEKYSYPQIKKVCYMGEIDDGLPGE